MHPIERLRYVAGATGADPGVVAREAAYALAEVAATDAAGLVPACRRLVDRLPTAGPLWWLAARTLSAMDPAQAARQAADELEGDPTAACLVRHLPEDATVVVVGWPEAVASALRRRGDAEVLVVDAGGEGAPLARRLAEAGSAVSLVAESGVGPAAAVAGLVLVEAHAAGPGGLLATPGSHAAAAVAAHAGVPVWAVLAVGRVLPGPLWEALLARFDQVGEPWERRVELVAADLLGAAVGPEGITTVAGGLAAATCPAAPELLRPAG
ncbi:MAG TPA: hypothetical protein VMW49_01140 [Candidatus Dormibacteraeota bacterium]|nr:hypothetical protein [Candidatus Dormibacteraeota bacterium]